ncbi:hypothetical protein [Mesomycoplasma hyopneumoniae]|uniref:hypothetical protein n=1 Tax=Mesomycoplasma hyopneumoniae TaxID=2099 RepID=UPI001E469A14|nr:hypothetical protein [Mesomycoplasma hyopneumoniae]
MINSVLLFEESLTIWLIFGRRFWRIKARLKLFWPSSVLASGFVVNQSGIWTSWAAKNWLRPRDSRFRPESKGLIEANSWTSKERKRFLKAESENFWIKQKNFPLYIFRALSKRASKG